MISYVCVAPPLVTVAVVSNSLPAFMAKRPVAVDTHALCAVGVGLGF
jgi:hypothetical protein